MDSIAPKSWLPAASQALVAAAEKRLLGKSQAASSAADAAGCSHERHMDHDSIGLNAGTT